MKIMDKCRRCSCDDIPTCRMHTLTYLSSLLY